MLRGLVLGVVFVLCMVLSLWLVSQVGVTPDNQLTPPVSQERR